MFNELRSDLVLLYELKQACANCEYELQMLRHRHEALARTGVLGGPATPAPGPAPASAEPAVPEPGLGPDPTKDTIIDVVGAPLTPNSRKRRESASSSSSPTQNLRGGKPTNQPIVDRLANMFAGTRPS